MLELDDELVSSVVELDVDPVVVLVLDDELELEVVSSVVFGSEVVSGGSEVAGVLVEVGSTLVVSTGVVLVPDRPTCRWWCRWCRAWCQAWCRAWCSGSSRWSAGWSQTRRTRWSGCRRRRSRRAPREARRTAPLASHEG
ncbi:hypothetical protein OV079_14110 [Nannocystis pusilla]|uniref:Uncharacterized protein n=1 Tax=Nannocystis pusilla TaxID=889268 RepID=A0A9X3EW41_9BACT|nr:hypothetical protein [Nannocystis pusilla]MCY1006663.1 hypothetical protein [Nannocystis pusilla]